MRNPFHSGYEIGEAEKKLNTSYQGFGSVQENKKRSLLTAQVILDRANSSDSVWKELFECLPLARAFFGVEMEEKLREVWKQRCKVLISSESLIGLDPVRNEAFYQDCEDDIWDGVAQAGNRPDRVAVAIEGAISFAEERILPVLAPDSLPKAVQ